MGSVINAHDEAQRVAKNILVKGTETNSYTSPEEKLAAAQVLATYAIADTLDAILAELRGTGL